MAETLCNFDKRSTSKWNFSDLSLLTLKSIKFFMPFLQPRVSFTSNFAPLFSVMRYHSSVLFHVKRYMLWTKGTHKSANFQIFDCSREISGNYDRRLFSAEKVQGIYVSWRWGVMQKLKKDWFIVSKMTRIWWILTWALKSIKNCTLIGLFCAKYIMFGLKKYRGALHGAEEWCKIWKKKLNYGFENDMRNLPNFHQTLRKSQYWGFDGILLSKVENV